MAALNYNEIIDYIKDHQGEEMTGQILADNLYSSKSNMCRRLKLLEDQGKIKRIKTIVITDEMEME